MFIGKTAFRLQNANAISWNRSAPTKFMEECLINCRISLIIASSIYLLKQLGIESHNSGVEHHVPECKACFGGIGAHRQK